jgi:hypothetical protein
MASFADWFALKLFLAMWRCQFNLKRPWTVQFWIYDYRHQEIINRLQCEAKTKSDQPNYDSFREYPSDEGTAAWISKKRVSELENQRIDKKNKTRKQTILIKHYDKQTSIGVTKRDWLAVIFRKEDWRVTRNERWEHQSQQKLSLR